MNRKMVLESKLIYKPKQFIKELLIKGTKLGSLLCFVKTKYTKDFYIKANFMDMGDFKLLFLLILENLIMEKGMDRDSNILYRLVCY